MNYQIVEAHDVKQLEEKVNLLILSGWSCVGGPFTYSWAEGCGPIQEAPTTMCLWLYITFCQAMELRS